MAHSQQQLISPQLSPLSLSPTPPASAFCRAAASAAGKKKIFNPLLQTLLGKALPWTRSRFPDRQTLAGHTDTQGWEQWLRVPLAGGLSLPAQAEQAAATLTYTPGPKERKPRTYLPTASWFANTPGQNPRPISAGEG